MQMIVSVLDKKAEAFTAPVCVPTKGIAIRGFGDAVTSGQGDIAAHPEDFALFHVGNWNPATGKIEPVSPVEIVSGLDYKKEVANA